MRVVVGKISKVSLARFLVTSSLKSGYAVKDHPHRGGFPSKLYIIAGRGRLLVPEGLDQDTAGDLENSSS